MSNETFAVTGFRQLQALETIEVAPGVTRTLYAWNDVLMMVRVAFKKGAIGAVHHHSHVQGSYISSGKFEVEINNAKKTLTEGDVFLVDPNLPHGVLCLEEGVLIDIFTPARLDFLPS